MISGFVVVTLSLTSLTVSFCNCIISRGMAGISASPVKFSPHIPAPWSYSAAGFLFDTCKAQWGKDNNEDDGIAIVAAVSVSVNKQQSLEAVKLGEWKTGALLIWQSGT